MSDYYSFRHRPRTRLEEEEHRATMLLSSVLGLILVGITALVLIAGGADPAADEPMVAVAVPI